MTDITGRKVLIVEDEALIALDLQQAVEDAGGTVLGPCMRVETALRILDRETVDAAILDIDVAGSPIDPIAERLASQHVPMVFHTARNVGFRLSARLGAAIAPKPARSESVVALLGALPGGAPLASGRAGPERPGRIVNGRSLAPDRSAVPG